ncbi:uncharacterized protein LOC135346500 isoform X3 [Halichondria panicea]|uniref:uncharacterized protein LOC135346500 isoform X3 n=1 Tax=Halichondria panicea TaxID=6063 RepID=UPI00312B3F2C
MSEDIHYLQEIRDTPRLQPYIKQGVVSTGRQLGSGAFGYVVELQFYGAACAGKKIHETFLDPLNKGIQHIVDKFLTECELMSQMHHPNIVHFYGLAFLDDSFSPVLVMERLDKSLDDFLETIPAKEVSLFLRLSILYDVAKGLVFLHSYQPPIIHRDLTAQNILLTSTTQAKIADLGNFHIIDPETVARHLSQTPGTLDYMPPEANGAPAIYDTGLDIFSFGHMSLFVFGHQFPSPLLHSTYSDPNSHPPNKLCARSEVERRITYFEEIEKMKAIPSEVIGMVKLCLDNMPECRPTSKKMSEMLSSAMHQEDQKAAFLEQAASLHETSKENAMKKLSMSIEQPPSITGASIQLTKIMGGSHFVMEMQICHGKKKNQCSKRCVLHLEDGKLKYQKWSEKKVKELNLESVNSVEPVYKVPQFRFAVHFMHKKKKQTWYFKADTEEERDCWVTALGIFINPSQPDLAYEIVEPFPQTPRAQRREKSHPLPSLPLRSRSSETELPRVYTEADAALHQKAQKVAFSRQTASLHKTSEGNYEQFKPHYHRTVIHTQENPSYNMLSTKPQMQGAMSAIGNIKQDSLTASSVSQGQMLFSSKKAKKISLQEFKYFGNTSEVYDDVASRDYDDVDLASEEHDDVASENYDDVVSEDYEDVDLRLASEEYDDVASENYDDVASENCDDVDLASEEYDDVESENYNDVVSEDCDDVDLASEECDDIANTSKCIQKTDIDLDLDDNYDEICRFRYINITSKKESTAGTITSRSTEVQIQEEQTTPVGGGTPLPGLYGGNEIMRVRSSSLIQGSCEETTTTLEVEMSMFQDLSNMKIIAKVTQVSLEMFSVASSRT